MTCGPVGGLVEYQISEVDVVPAAVLTPSVKVFVELPIVALDILSGIVASV